MRRNHFTDILAAALTGIVAVSGLMACSNEGDGTGTQTAQEAPTYQVSIAAAIGNEAQTRAGAPTKDETINGWEIIDATRATRAVSYNSTTGALESRFLTTDYIGVANMTTGTEAQSGYYQYMFLRPDAEGKTANLTGSLIFMNGSNKEEVAVGQTLRLMYANKEHSNIFIYRSQSGTLSSLNDCDFALADVTIENISGDKDNGYTLTTSKASFVNAQSMYKFTFTGLDEGAGIKTLTIHSAKGKLVTDYLPNYEGQSYEYVFGDITITLYDSQRSANGPGVVYAALRFQPVGEGQTDAVTFEVKDTNNKEYSVTKTAPAGGFQNGKFYTSTIDLTDQNNVLSGNIDISTIDNAVIADGATLTGTLSGSHRISIADGASVTLNGVTLSSSAQAGIVCKGSATINLMGTNSVCSTLSGCAGIQPGPAGSTLTIQGSGSLTATGAQLGAGIGSGNNVTCGNIVIAGGMVTANGGYRSAGIGTGTGGESVCGNITISGGTVTAIGYAGSIGDDVGAAGIGSGAGFRDSSYGTTCGNITISGGTVTATGGRGCAGIGSGTSFSSPDYKEISSCGNIEISGGTVTANGGAYGVGIGSGYVNSSSGNYSKCGNILISGGTVYPNGADYALAIGTGCLADIPESLVTCGTITITENILKIIGYSGHGSGRLIGTYSTSNCCGDVTIDGEKYAYSYVSSENREFTHLRLTCSSSNFTLEPKSP